MKEQTVKLPHTSEYIMRGTSNGWGEYVGELIRCKDCKYNNGGRCGWHGGAGYKWVVDDDDFCSCGERRTE